MPQEPARLFGSVADGPLNVLLVEDNPGDARLVQELVKEASAPINVSWVQSLDEGVKKVLAGGFDAVLLDLSLPDSRGLESVSHMHLFDAGVPIVVLTSLNDPEAAFTAIREGAQEYLVKGTVDGAQIERALRFAMHRASLQNRLLEEPGPAPRSPDEVAVHALVCPTGVGLVPVLANYVAELQKQSSRVLYVCLDRPALVLREPFLRAGAQEANLRFLDAASGHRERRDAAGIVHADAKDLHSLAIRIEEECAELGRSTYVLLDSINSLLLHHPLDKVAGFVHALANRLRLLGIPAGLIAHQNQEWVLLADRFASFLDGEVDVRLEPPAPARRAVAGDDPSVA